MNKTLDITATMKYNLFMCDGSSVNNCIKSFERSLSNALLLAHTLKTFGGLVIERLSGLFHCWQVLSPQQDNKILPVVSNGIVRLTEWICLDCRSTNLVACEAITTPQQTPTSNRLAIQNTDTKYPFLKTNAKLLITGSLLSLRLSRWNVYSVRYSCAA